MTIATYFDLKDAVADWLARDTDPVIAARSADFIALFEARLRRTLRLRRMEERDTALVSARYTALPGGFLEMRRLHLADGTAAGRPLAYLAPIELKRVYPDAVTGRPAAFTVIDGEIELGPTPDAVYPLEMAFYRFEGLSEARPGNWLLADHPDIYLFGALVEASGFIQAIEQAGAWKAELDQRMEELRRADQAGRWSGAPLAARPDMRVV